MAKKKSDAKKSNEAMTIQGTDGETIANFSPELLDVLRGTVAKGATDEELYMFLQVASMYKLNPFMKEIWFVKMGKDQQIMTSRDGYMNIAKQNPKFVKCQSSAVYENDEFRMEYENGDLKKLIHNHGHTDRGKLIGAWAMVKMLGNDHIAVYCDFKEYDKRTNIWRKYPTAMIRKVAENDVLKRFAGISGIVSVEDAPLDMERASKEYIDVDKTTGWKTEDTNEIYY